MMKLLGLFKWYDSEKGFGVISTLLPKVNETQDVFFHHSCWTGKIPSELKGVPVSFMVRERRRDKGYEAWDCSLFDSSLELWQYLFDNKEYNLLVNTEYGIINILQVCVSMINTPQNANNFIQAFNQWQTEHPIHSCKDILDCLKGGKNVKVQGFYYYIQSVTSSIPFEERKELFENRQIGLNCFSDSETLHIIDLIDKSQYEIIKDVRSDLYLKLIRERILKAVADINFSNYSIVKKDDFSALLEEFYSLSSVDAKQELQREIDRIILSKEDEFVARVEEIIELPFGIDNSVFHLKNLLSFPYFFSSATISHFEETAYCNIKERGDFRNNIKLMSRRVLPTDISYINNNIHTIDNELIQAIVEEVPFSSSEIVCGLLFDYLEVTGDIDTTIYLYNKTPDIQKNAFTEAIKNSINDKCLEPDVSFVSKAADYIDLLGEDYVFSTTQKYLIATHSSEAVLKQLSQADDKYKERLSQLLLSYLTDYRDNIDEDFVKPFCETNLKEVYSFVTEDYIVDIIEAFSDNHNDFKQALSYAGVYGPVVKATIEEYAISKLSEKEYMNLWKEGRCQKLPEGYFDSFIDDNEDNYSLVDSWLKIGRLTEEMVQSSMLKTLEKIRNIPYYRYFRTEFHIFNYLSKHNWDSIITSAFEESKINLFKWAIEPSYTDYGFICKSFILFPEAIQVKLLRFIFLSIAQGVIRITANDLQRLYDCTPEFMNYSVEDQPTMSLSVSVIIEALCSYEKYGEFHLGNKDLFKLLYSYVHNSSENIEPIGEFFDKCTGKKVRKYPSHYSIRRFIFPIIDKNKNRFFIINFEYDKELIEKVKTITGRKFEKDRKFWYAPERSYSEIERFACDNRFFLLNKNIPPSVVGQPFTSIMRYITDKEYYQAAWHLSYLSDRTENNKYRVSWCEGHESQDRDEHYVWWCVGHSSCHACSIHLHSNGDWQKYTLFDFCNILGFNLVETNKYGQFKTGRYIKLVKTINRFNDLLERLYCRGCGSILYPTELNFAVYGANTFKCINSNCEEYNNSIYLNHCYTDKCRGIIDSRDGAKCPNGLVICSTCGTCCTTDMFQQRLDRLISRGSNFIPSGLIWQVEHDQGHINHRDKSKDDEFYCHKCGSRLNDPPTNTVCGNCGTEIHYETDLINKR